jgi:hypothetical protein
MMDLAMFGASGASEALQYSVSFFGRTGIELYDILDDVLLHTFFQKS